MGIHFHTNLYVLPSVSFRIDELESGFVEVLADVLDAMEAGEAEEALGEIVERTVSSCEEEEEKMDCGKARSWYVRLWGRVVAADICDEHRNAVRYDYILHAILCLLQN